MSRSAFILVVCLGVAMLTVANYLNWQRQRAAERDLALCIREYRILLEERP